MKQNDYDEAYSSFWNSFGSGRHMVLSTVCSDHVSSRMMSVVNIDGCLYFQTFRTSRKYEHLKANSQVALCCDNIQIEGSAEEAGHPLDNPAFCTAFREKTLRLNARFSTVYGYRGLRDGSTKMAGRFLKSLIQTERYTRWKNRITGTDEKTVH